MNNTLISYAQNREDLILWVLLHRVREGFYVDVGANDPTMDSVTKFFYDRGWHGINIEPIQSVYKQLIKFRPKDINLNMGVSNVAGKLAIREYSDGWHGWSTFSPNVMKRHAGKKHQDYSVTVEPLSSIFCKYNVKEIDFLKVDVEGFEYEVLSSNDWHKYQPKVIVVEGDGKWVKLLSDLGYSLVFADGLNKYFVKNELVNSLSMKDYTATLLSGQTVLSNREYSLQKQFQQVNKVIAELNSQLGNIQNQYDALNNKWLKISKSPEEFISGRLLAVAAMRRLLMKFGIKKSK